MSLGCVLIVDDEVQIGVPMTELLRRAGFECQLCRTADEARATLKEKEYDFALIDFNLGTGDPLDGTHLFDELEQNFPGMETEVFTSKEKPEIGERPAFEILKYEVGGNDFKKVEEAILKGVARGLQKRLQWQRSVMRNARIRSAVLDENSRVLWENNRDGDGTIEDFLNREVLTHNGNVLGKALQEHMESFEDIMTCSDGRTLECDLNKLPASVTGVDRPYWMLTTKETTRSMNAANLARELLQHDKFEIISNLICEGLLNLEFDRARLWILQGDSCTLALYRERGHGLTPEQINECKMDFRTNENLRMLLGEDNRDPYIVPNPSVWLPLKLCKLLTITDDFSTLAIPLFVRDELLGMLTVDKASASIKAGKGKNAIGRSDVLIGKQIGRLAAAALDRGIHAWQFERVQHILSLTAHRQPDDRIDEIYQPVFQCIVESLGNDPNTPWLPQFKGAEIAVRRSRLARTNRFYLIYNTTSEQGVFPPIVDITEGLIGDVMAEVSATKPDRRCFEIKTFRNIFTNKAFQKHFLKLMNDDPTSPYTSYLKKNQTKTMIPLLDLDKELLGFLCFHAPCTTKKRPDEHRGHDFTLLHRRWLVVLGQLCSRILEIRERHWESVRVLNQLYSEIDKKQALANYGEMCGDITHEIPKYFQIILNAVHLLHTDLKKERDPLKRLDTIREATLDGNSRLETLKKLFKDTKQLGKGKTSVAQAIDRTLKKFDVSNLTTVTCVTDIPNNLPVWPLTSDQSQTCISILLQNACESIRDAGRTDGRIEIKAHWESPKLSLTVTDNGGGFAPEHHADLFEVGFSTKPYFSDRMGLGLSLVRRIVNGHNGTIEAKSDFGHGAVFQIEFTIDLSPAR